METYYELQNPAIFGVPLVIDISLDSRDTPKARENIGETNTQVLKTENSRCSEKTTDEESSQCVVHIERDR